MDYTIYFKDSRDMSELPDESVHLIVTSPPYFNAPHDYPDMFSSYEEFLSLIEDVAAEMFRVLAKGRVVAVVIDDMLVDGVKYPIVADTTVIFRKVGFRYRDRLVWVKPRGFVRKSRRSGVLVQHPYPMYFYPDNICESILIFQKGKFNHKSVFKELKERSRVDVSEYLEKEWFLNVWQVTNVLPNSKLEKGIAAFPEEIPRRLIKLFSFVGDTVLDPFAGSGTTLKVALELGRKAVGYEIDESLSEVIEKKLRSVRWRH